MNTAGEARSIVGKVRVTSRETNVWQALILGMVSALIGLSPWLTSGMKLPLQNLWAETVMPDDMPLVLLPFSQYSAASVVSMIFLGWVFLGLLTRRISRAESMMARISAGLGVLAVQSAALIQTAVVVSGGLQVSEVATAYLFGIIGAAVLAVLSGLVAFWFIANGSRAAALIQLTLACIALLYWWTMFADLGTFHHNVASLFSQCTPMIAPILVGLSIVWCGVTGVKQILAVCSSLLLLWALTAFIAAVTLVIGSRALLQEPSSIMGYVFADFLLFLRTDTPRLVLIAAVVAIVGLVVKRVFAERQARLASSEES